MRTTLTLVCIVVFVHTSCDRSGSKWREEAERRRASDQLMAEQMAKEEREARKAEESDSDQASAKKDRDFREALLKHTSKRPPPADVGAEELARLKKLTEPDGSVEQTKATEPAEAGAKSPVDLVPDQESKFKEFADRIFIVKGDKGSGSGLVCEIDGKPVCMTNTHVLSGNTKLTFVRPDGKVLEVTPDQLQVALNRDLAFLPLKSPQPTLKIFTGATLNIGEEVVCLGNTQGQSVITDIKGKILGVGPDQIEVDADVMQGNSGCPVINRSTGLVIGVVTGAYQAPLSVHNEGTRFAELRKFCVRIYGAEWRRIGWTTFATEAGFIESYRQHRRQLDSLASDLIAGSINPPAYENSSVSIRAAVRAFVVANSNTKLTPADRLKAQAAFLRDIEFEIRKGPFEEIAALKTKAALMCAYHRNTITDEIKLREKMAEVIRGLEGAAIAIAASSTAPATPSRRQ